MDIAVFTWFAMRFVKRYAVATGAIFFILTGLPTTAAPYPAKQDIPKSAKQTAKKKKSTKTARADAKELGPIHVFADIEDGWRREKVDKILSHFGKGKVNISIEGTGPSGGAFSRNQSHYLFKDLFKYTITEKFEFVQYRNVSDGRVKVYAVAERHYKRNDDGRLFKDKIYVSLHQEGDRWVVDEIKSIR